MAYSKDGSFTTAKPDATPFKKDSCMADIILLVQGEKMYVNKGMLMLASPVFRKIFSFEFKESREITLPGKQIHHVVAFLRCIHPAILDVIDEKNVFEVLPLADDYQCGTLKERCEQYLIGRIPKDNVNLAREQNTKYVVKCLLIAEKFSLKELLKICVNCLSETHSFYLKGPQFDAISEKRKFRIFRKRINSVEKQHHIVPGLYNDRITFIDEKIPDTDDED